MGKKSVIRSLGKCIGNIALHKILLKHTNRPESKKHLSDEILDYGEDAFEKAIGYSWSEKEKEDIRLKANKRVKNIIRNYNNIIYNKKEANEFIKELIKEIR